METKLVPEIGKILCHHYSESLQPGQYPRVFPDQRPWVQVDRCLASEVVIEKEGY